MEHAHNVVRWLARIGYGARGLVYLAVGVIALHAALEFEQARDVHGAMREIENQPGGRLVLFGLALGLVAYSIWRVVQSLLDVDRHGFGLRGTAVRAGLLGSSFLHASLAWACAEMALALGSRNGKPLQQAVETTLDWPLGPGMVVAGGLVIAGAGAAHLYKAATGGFLRWFEASPRALRWIDPVSRIGLSARGVVFMAMACFVIYSALTFDASDTRGLEGIMLWIQDRMYGRVLLGVLSLGLLAFGSYSVIEAFVRRVGLKR